LHDAPDRIRSPLIKVDGRWQDRLFIRLRTSLCEILIRLVNLRPDTRLTRCRKEGQNNPH
jgi:hypothetical protein